MIGTISYIIDIYTGKNILYKNCYNDYNIHIDLLLHHIINIYAQFGWLSNTRFLLQCYIFTCILVLYHWNSNNDKCFLTEKINKKCIIDTNQPFRDILYAIGFKHLKQWKFLHRVYIFIGGLIALCKLSRL